MKLNGRVILITGGTSGIGYELVRLLATRNKLILVLGRDPLKLASLETDFDNVRTYACCLTSTSQIDQVLEEVKANYPDISVVINNAAVQEVPTLLDPLFRYDKIEHEIAINLAAPVKICALMLTHFMQAKQPAAFININSGLALFPKTSSAVYCATKAGLHSFSRSLRYQLQGTSIRIYESMLPLVDTPMTRSRGGSQLTAMKAAEAIVAGVEAGREEVYVGKARLIPLLARISPRLMAKIMKRG